MQQNTGKLKQAMFASESRASKWGGEQNSTGINQGGSNLFQLCMAAASERQCRRD